MWRDQDHLQASASLVQPLRQRLRVDLGFVAALTGDLQIEPVARVIADLV